MTNELYTFGVNMAMKTLGLVTLGLSNKINGGIKDLSHEIVEISALCLKCNENYHRTIELLEAFGPKKGKGFYSKSWNKYENEDFLGFRMKPNTLRKLID